MISASFDRSKILQLYARIGEIGVPLILTFLDTNGDPYPISGIDFKFIAKRKPTDIDPAFELSIGDGLTVVGTSLHQLKIELSEANSEQRNETYFYRLYDYEELHTWLNGPLRFHNGEFDASADTETITVTFDSEVVEITISNLATTPLPPATQSEVNTGTEAAKYVSPATLAAKALKSGTYSTTLTFDTDQDIYQDLTGQSVTFTLGSNGVNGVGIILRLNKPTAVTFPGTFEADANSATLDATKLNVYTLVFFTNWNGSGLDHVIYSNHLFTAQ